MTEHQPRRMQALVQRAFGRDPRSAVDWAAFASLPPPDVALQGWGHRALRRVAEACFKQMERVASEGPSFLRALPRPSLAGHWAPRTRTDKNTERRIVMVLTSYYCHVAPELHDAFIKSKRIDFAPFPGANVMMQIARPREWHERLVQPDRLARLTAQVVVALNHVLGSVVLCTTTRMWIRRAMDLSEVAMDDAAGRLVQAAEASQSPCQTAALFAALRCCTAVMTNYHDHVSRSLPLADAGGPSSPMSAAALNALSQRTADAIRQFGSKHAEDVFETQLALLFQTLGFFVVRTRRRWRAIDMVCVSRGAPDPVTVLVEAKTSARPYRLPVDDERAIAEYVKVLRTSLQGVPPLRAVLIVGGPPSKTLGSRLRKLESAVSLPVRYCTAGDLALLRERAMGLLMPTELVRSVLAAADVVSSAQLTALAESVAGTLRAFREFVRTSVAASGAGGASTPSKTQGGSRLNR